MDGQQSRDQKKRSLEALSRLIDVIAALRHPGTGCPWDLQQNHESLRRYMIEEAYEAAEAMAGSDSRKIADELGDVLLQVVLNSQVGLDSGNFSLADVATCIADKMVRRHPHVFGTEEERKERQISQIFDKWREIKKSESPAGAHDTGVFAGKDIAGAHPASRQATEIGKRAKVIDFDWSGPNQVFTQVMSEIAELEAAWADATPATLAGVIEEIGDVYFSLAQLCRHLNHDPEIVAWDGNRKFLKRFAIVEDLAQQRGIDVRSCGQTILERLWIEAKALQSVAH